MQTHQDNDTNEVENIDPAIVYNFLLIMWQNEYNMPHIQAYSNTIVQMVQKYLSRNKEAQMRTTNKLVQHMLKIQQYRMSYIISSYMNLRQKKILRGCAQDEDKLSDSELQFKREVEELRNQLLEQEQLNGADQQVVNHLTKLTQEGFDKQEVPNIARIVRFEEDYINETKNQHFLKGDKSLQLLSDIQQCIDDRIVTFLK